jgi:hypothetical protein
MPHRRQSGLNCVIEDPRKKAQDDSLKITGDGQEIPLINFLRSYEGIRSDGVFGVTCHESFSLVL